MVGRVFLFIGRIFQLIDRITQLDNWLNVMNKILLILLNTDIIKLTLSFYWQDYVQNSTEHFKHWTGRLKYWAGCLKYKQKHTYLKSASHGNKFILSIFWPFWLTNYREYNLYDPFIYLKRWEFNRKRICEIWFDIIREIEIIFVSDCFCVYVKDLLVI